MNSFQDELAEIARLTDDALDRLIPAGDGPEAQVLSAMRYSALAGGKRIRPLLVIASADLFNVSRTSSERVAAAVEMVHAYSLVHDDLPAMDNDDLRRGRPTCHMEFDEATAILAGDGLLTLAFEVLAGDETHSLGEIRAELALELARAIGAHGMVGGQMLDLMAADHELDVHEITRLQRMKTGALISYSCQAGAILGKAAENQRHMLAAYAHDLGLAFQIIDDLLDVEGDAEEMGKRTGKDGQAGKATFVSLLGPERAREQANILADQAIKHLEIFAEKGDLLGDLAEFVVRRRK
ncbi:MAG: polyprenyl synthetase family protein [Rhodospirillales bacterium]|nr:polyprenyl synthetase family protein [Rhodospirillales bacterium]MDP6645488.1 polyprenyl synthetase family protein [Rhodospirillales bacterium]MDP6843495.1 polyprenyl synthetase family protein [Rhodospirillales bacterium]